MMLSQNESCIKKINTKYEHKRSYQSVNMYTVIDKGFDFINN